MVINSFVYFVSTVPLEAERKGERKGNENEKSSIVSRVRTRGHVGLGVSDDGTCFVPAQQASCLSDRKQTRPDGRRRILLNVVNLNVL